jgi:hypothetical protein
MHGHMNVKFVPYVLTYIIPYLNLLQLSSWSDPSVSKHVDVEGTVKIEIKLV